MDTMTNLKHKDCGGRIGLIRGFLRTASGKLSCRVCTSCNKAVDIDQTQGGQVRQLTQEQAERCARACGWERKEGKKRYMWRIGAYDTATKWWELNGEWQGIDPHPNFLDPYFWFGRLWDRLEDLCMHKDGTFTSWFSDQYLLYDGSRWDYRIKAGLVDVNADHPCLALCAAIEALEDI